MTRRKSASEITGAHAKRIRKEAKLNQTEFWGEFGVSQSGGCRYEQGRPIPAPVRILLEQKYGAASGTKAAKQATGGAS